MVNWLLEESQAWKPPEKMTVSEWADKNRIIGSKASITNANMKWKTDFTPYLREIMDTYNDPYIEEVAFCKPTQVGGTETGFNVIGYIIDQEPASMLIVYPSEKQAESISDNRIKPMIELSEPLKEKWLEAKSKKLELQFPGMYIALIGANSPGQLASKPIGKIIFDETDKYPDFTGDESDPISLGTERSKNFRNRKIYKWSTPTLESKPIWKALMASNVIKQFFVPCPHCGHRQVFKFSQIKWPKDLDDIKDYKEKARLVEELAWYECEECHQVIDETRHKINMLRNGQWLPVRWDEKEGKFYPTEMPKGRIKKVGFHINSIYSPMVSFGKVAAEFILSKDFPEKLMNFVNSWLAEPWRRKTDAFKSNIILQKQHNTGRGIVPFELGETILTAGVDRQKGHFWYSVHAWGPGFTGRLVEYAQVMTWTDIENAILERRYRNEKGQEFRVICGMVDSGYDTQAVYDFCAMHKEIFLPSKGANRRLTAPYQISSLEKRKNGKQWISGLKLYEIDTDYYKDFIFGRLEKEPEELGSWTLFKNCPEEFADHLSAEKKVEIIDKKSKRITLKWLPFSEHAPNHLLDTSVYAAAAAEINGVRYLKSVSETQKQAQNQRRRVLSRGVS